MVGAGEGESLRKTVRPAQRIRTAEAKEEGGKGSLAQGFRQHDGRPTAANLAVSCEMSLREG